ncbi:MAG: FxDxF family PEP-CTERM protein [Candidatus Sphingomonas colombiensis]|nr:FxDxF family PEP-CTERM protein [Sphingomonas sp.]WEK41795.1 MAG: FxDxF family PEP-CTERM protein [Sphingomonas sp.]
MKTMAFFATAAAAAFVAAPASAATTINLVPVLGTLSGAFGNLNPHRSGTDVYNFTVPSDGDVFGFVGSIGLKLTLTNLDFTKVTLNGVDFDINSTGILEDRTISLPVLAGLQTLSVSYKNAQAFSSYGGFVSFTAGAIGAVPEPATWALMILGMGGVAGAMRHRRRTTATVRFA